MKKEQIELIIVKVTSDNQEALNIKIYKDGTTCRRGVGSLPELGVSAMSFFPDDKFFTPLLEKLPLEIIGHPLNYEEDCPNGYLEYIVAFYGVSKNGETGERAQWTESDGIRVKLDHQSTFRHPIMGFLDRFAINAAEITNAWYFDVMINARYKALSTQLPPQTMIAQPKTEAQILATFTDYINQMMGSAWKWQIADFGRDKLYAIGTNSYIPVIHQDDATFSIHFMEPSDTKDAPASVPAATPAPEGAKSFWQRLFGR